MYNDEIKRQFLKEIDASGRTLEGYERELGRVSAYEELFHKDLCEFTTEEFQKVVNELGGSSTHSLQTKASNYRRYVRWVYDSGHDELHPNTSLFLMPRTSQSKVDASGNISKSLIKDPQHLKKILDAVDVFNDTPPTFMGLNKIRRVFAWLMYAGLSQEDIVKIKDENVDLKHRMIVFGDDMYPIYYLSIQDFKDLLSMKEMSAKKTPRKIVVQLPRIEGDLLLRGEANPTFKSLYNNFAMLLSEAAKHNPDVIPLSYKKVHMSGIFYEAYLEETETGIEPRFVVQAKRDLERTKNWQTSSEKSKKDRVYKWSLNMRNDYRKWKIAFDLVND